MLTALFTLALAASPTDGSTLTVTVVSLDFSYPYFGEPGNPCKQRGSVFVRGLTDPNGARTPVVVRLSDSAGLSPGTEAVLADVHRAGTGRDGTAVYCAAGRYTAPAPSAVVTPAPEKEVAPAPTPSPAPLVAAPAPVPAGCTARLFHVIKKPLAENKFGPSEFDPASAHSEPEPVDCSLARSRVTNVLLLKMVKDGAANPAEILGAEWGPGSSWSKEPDAQRRVVKVYFAAAP